jgi:hypothetical protein
LTNIQKENEQLKDCNGTLRHEITSATSTSESNYILKKQYLNETEKKEKELQEKNKELEEMRNESNKKEREWHEKELNYTKELGILRAEKATEVNGLKAQIDDLQRKITILQGEQKEFATQTAEAKSRRALKRKKIQIEWEKQKKHEWETQNNVWEQERLTLKMQIQKVETQRSILENEQNKWSQEKLDFEKRLQLIAQEKTSLSQTNDLLKEQLQNWQTQISNTDQNIKKGLFNDNHFDEKSDLADHSQVPPMNNALGFPLKANNSQNIASGIFGGFFLTNSRFREEPQHQFTGQPLQSLKNLRAGMNKEKNRIITNQCPKINRLPFNAHISGLNASSSSLLAQTALKIIGK